MWKLFHENTHTHKHTHTHSHTHTHTCMHACTYTQSIHTHIHIDSIIINAQVSKPELVRMLCCMLYNKTSYLSHIYSPPEFVFFYRFAPYFNQMTINFYLFVIGYIIIVIIITNVNIVAKNILLFVLRDLSSLGSMRKLILHSIIIWLYISILSHALICIDSY